MANINWPSVVARMAKKVDDCCGCNYFAYLTDEEADAADQAIREQAIRDEEAASG